MPVKIRPVHAGKLGYATNGHPATATHPGAINHYWIQANNSFHPERPGGQGTELHHDGRANGNDSVNFLPTLKQLLQWHSYYPFATIRAIIGSNYQLVADTA